VSEPVSDVPVSGVPPTDVVVVAAALIDARGRVLVAQRSEPPAIAGLWEFPGGKIEPGESETDALVRECVEELGVSIEPGWLVGETRLPNGALLRVWTGTVLEGEPQALEHLALRWLATDEFDQVPWIDADAPIVDALRAQLAAARGR
jgi:8-oxo-dGTP diphosphatase